MTLPETWPDNGIEFNLWHKDAAGFAKLLQENTGFWCFDPDLKYLNIRIDTRDGHFVITDRENQKISANRVLAAIKIWRNETKGE